MATESVRKVAEVKQRINIKTKISLALLKEAFEKALF